MGDFTKVSSEHDELFKLIYCNGRQGRTSVQMHEVGDVTVGVCGSLFVSASWEDRKLAHHLRGSRGVGGMRREKKV